MSLGGLHRTMDAKCYRQFSAFPSYDIKYCPPVRCHWHHRDMQTVYFDVRSLMHVPVLDILRQQSSLKSNKVALKQQSSVGGGGHKFSRQETTDLCPV